MLQATKTTAIASTALCSRASCFPLSQVYSLPAGLLTSAAFTDLMAAASKVLLLRFGNARDIVDSPTLLQQFLSLPFAAVETLFLSPELATDAEDTILLLFSSWCLEEPGKSCSEEQLLALTATIRYSRLSSAYLTELCRSLACPQLTHNQLMELLHVRGDTTGRQLVVLKGYGQVGHDTWYLPCRPSSPSHATTTVQLTVKEAELKLLLAAVGDLTSAESVSSPAVFAAGFLWTLKLCIEGGDPWWVFSAYGVSALQTVQQTVPFRHGVTCEFSLHLTGEAPIVLRKNGPDCINTRGVGLKISLPNHGDLQGPLRMEQWAPYIVDGCVHLTAEIESIER